MSVKTFTTPEEIDLYSDRLKRALGMLDEAVNAGFLPGFCVAINRYGKPIVIGYGGQRRPENDVFPVESDTIFLIASLTKPIVCAGALTLLEEGAFSLQQPVYHFIPDFGAGMKRNVRLIHLFTHTSGLQDQIPTGIKLRRSQAPIREYVQAVCNSELLFSPGTNVSYQSMGILLIGEIVERISGMRLRDFLRKRLFVPLDMKDTWLGLPPGGMKRSAYSLDAPFPPDSNDVGDDWNTPYWRDFGAPWGGLHSTAADLSRFLSHMTGDIPGPLSSFLRTAMMTDQVAVLPDVPQKVKDTNRWGLGWLIGADTFGTLVSRSTFGHRGATGALFWADPSPESRLSCVLLTNQPRLWLDTPEQFAELPSRFSNVVAASIIA